MRHRLSSAGLILTAILAMPAAHALLASMAASGQFQDDGSCH
jgi:hypothetical protein